MGKERSVIGLGRKGRGSAVSVEAASLLDGIDVVERLLMSRLGVW